MTTIGAAIECEKGRARLEAKLGNIAKPKAIARRHSLSSHALVGTMTLMLLGCVNPQATRHTELQGSIPRIVEPEWCFTFMVFFDSEDASLGPEARAVVAEAVKARNNNECRRGGLTNILITGHADRAEHDADGVSLRRANAVKTEMVRLGVPIELVSVRGTGNRDPMVITAPNVAEAQNRRAVIEFVK